ncbi:chemotaxis protein CheW [Bacillus mexicanus]|uniref:chemotaxis protein CheW n=1 Tax=Bacillus mexicanus TaxID=2834415 RepID=UPI003D1BC05B
MKVLTFYLEEKKYGVSIEHIITIEKNDREITEIPNAHNAIRGVVNVRSKICPVIDLKMVVQNIENEIDDTKKLILFEIAEKSGALLVDDTDNIMDVEQEHIEDFDNGDVKAKVVNQEGDVYVLIEMEDFDNLLN